MNSNEKLQLSRLLSRPSDPPLTASQASSRISSQLPLSTKLLYATSVVDNSGTLSDLESQIDRLVQKWYNQQGGSTGWWWRICWLIPPVGLVAGAICLLARWFRIRRGPRRRARGEMERKGNRDGGNEGERIELRDMRRRRDTGSSITDGD